MEFYECGICGCFLDSTETAGKDCPNCYAEGHLITPRYDYEQMRQVLAIVQEKVGTEAVLEKMKELVLKC